MAPPSSALPRCSWCGSHDDYVAYHDKEWGVPVTDDNKLFEMLTLEGAQAGLSWLTILRKREGYRTAFESFVPESVAGFSESRMSTLKTDSSIVRNRLKIESTVSNASAVLNVQEEFGSFAAYIWAFVDGVPIQNSFMSLRDVPAKTPLAERISKDMKKRGFRFVGPTIVYAFMQATGMVNDHVQSCYRHAEVTQLGLKPVL